jgi:tetratricopeptide (TPR) repeat protein
MENRLANLPTKRLRQMVEQGFRALAEDDQVLAEECCRKALREKPDFARAHYLAAVIALANGDRESARQALETVVKLNPRYAPGWAQLARYFVTAGDFVKADTCLRNAVTSETGNAEVRDVIGTVYRLAGKLEASREWHAKAVAKDGEHVPFLVNQATACRLLGDDAAAAEVLQSAIEVSPSDAQLHWLLSTVTGTASPEHTRKMCELLEDVDQAGPAAYLQYAIGAGLEEQGSWPEAGKAFSAAARAQRETLDYNEAADVSLFEAAEATFTEDWLATRDAGPGESGPIFVVGEPCGDIALLDRIIRAHTAVSSAGELRHLAYAVRSVSGDTGSGPCTAEFVAAAAGADVKAIGDAYLRTTKDLFDTPHIVDLMPHNYLYLPLIAAALPGARVLHIYRDSRDACYTIFKQHLGSAYPYSCDQEELARHYLRYRHLLRTWRERFPGRFLEVRLEDLVQDTKKTVQGMLEYLDLPWEAECIAKFDRDRCARSIGRWEQHAELLRPMLKVLASGKRQS